jgi:hypothetical protein
MELGMSSVRSLRRAVAVAVMTGALCTVAAPAAAATAAPVGSSSTDVVTFEGAAQGSGWLDEVRADSADSTKTVAGIAVLVVAGFTTAVTVRPRRRPPVEG